MAIEAHCGTLSALTLALPRSCAVPESRGTQAWNRGAGFPKYW